MATMGTSVSGISFSGLFSGMDTDKIVTQLMTLAQRPLAKLKVQQAMVQSQENAIDSLNSGMHALQTSANGLRNASSLRATTASTSSSSVVTVTSSTGSVEGTHSLEVHQLATGERMIKNVGLEAPTTVVGEGTFNYTYNGVTRSVLTTAQTTLQELAALINNDAANPGVAASLIYDGSDYYFSLTGSQTGASKTITINDAQTTLSGFDTADMTVTQQARNSQVRLDGWPAADWIERESNTISDLMAGVTFNLQSAGTATVTLARSTQALTNGLNDFVAAYNNVVNSLVQYTGYNSGTKKGGVLQGDTVARLLSGIRQGLITIPKGFVSGSETYTLIGQLGLAFDKNGKLSLDSTVLNDAIAEDYSAVLALVGAQATGVSDSSYIGFVSAVSTTAAGAYDLEVDFDADDNITTARIRPDGEVIWQYMDVDGSKLSIGTGSLAGLILTAATDGTVGEHTQTANIRIHQGFAGTVYDSAETLLDDTTGTLALKKQRFDATYESYTKRITKEQARLDKEETRLKAQYARLEATLAQISGQTAGFQSLLEQFNTNNTTNSEE